MEGEFEKAEIIFNLLLNNPHEFEYSTKPSAEREHNFMCTLNIDNVPISSARADDNGAYHKRGNASRFYFVKDGVCQITHKDDHGNHYIKVRDNSAATAKPVFVKKYVDHDFVYRLCRHYRYSRSNDFYNMIATIAKITPNSPPHKYYLYLNRWLKEIKHPKQFTVERHGNATWPHSGAYYRKEQTVFTDVRQKLDDGMSPDEAYLAVSKQHANASSVSQMLHNPKVVHNQKQKLQQQGKEAIPDDADGLIGLLQSGSFAQSVNFDASSYSSVNYTSQMLKDMHRFCVLGNSTWVVDTTFKVTDKFWLTDSSYENESLLDENGKHPVFPGITSVLFHNISGNTNKAIS